MKPSLVGLIVAIAVCCVAVQAQTYALGAIYPNTTACSGTVGYYMLIQLDACISQGNISSLMKQASSTTLSVYDYQAGDCSGNAVVSQDFTIGQCAQIAGAGTTDAVSFSITNTATVPVNGNAFMSDTLTSCDDTTPLSRIVYNPEYCFQLDMWSITYSGCNSTAYTLTEYSNAQCQGESTSFQQVFAPCSAKNLEVVLGCYSPSSSSNNKK